LSHFESGREYEAELARRLGLNSVPGSGNTPWLKLDLGDAGNVLLSVKWTGKSTFPLSRALFEEIEEAILAPGGVGGDVIGGLIVGVGGRDIVCLDVNDLARILKEKRRFGVQTKAVARRERAKTSILDRRGDD